MNLLAAKLYDPAGAVNKATTALLAMTALDTTNLRLPFIIPAHGMVRVRMAGTLHGAATCPQILLGVLEGSTVRGRMSPMYGATNIAATSHVKAEADFIITGLTPGAVNWDAAYGVETVVAATALKYGGPNNATANDAWGGFLFEIYDPQPLKVGLGGGVNMTQYVGVAQTVRDLGAMADVATSTRAPASTAISNADYTPTRAGKLDNLDVTVGSRLATAGYTAPPTANENRDAVFGRMVSSTQNFLQVFQLNSSTLLGINYGAGTLERGFRDLDNTRNAVVGTFDVVGPLRNRISVVYDPPPPP